jgi:hypothetical protein
MHLAYLASHTPQTGFAAWPWWLWLAYAVPVCGLIAYFYIRARRRRRPEPFEGQPLAGTARVLSAARAGGLGGLLQGSHSAVSSRIELRVEIPGHPPYDHTFFRSLDSHLLGALCVDGQRWGPGQTWQVKPDLTLPVQVDSANLDDVRVDFSAALSAADRRRYQLQYWYQWAMVGGGLLAAVIYAAILMSRHGG